MKLIGSAVAIIALAGITSACSPATPSKVESQSTVKKETPAGTETSQTKTEQVGSTVASTTESKTKDASGTTKVKDETVVGTVSKYEIGKSIEVITGNNDKHSFDLSGDKLTARVDAKVTVGSKVRLVQHTEDNGQKTVEVHLEAA